MKFTIISFRQIGILKDITSIISIGIYYFAIIIPANTYSLGYLRSTTEPISGYQGVTPNLLI